MSYQPSNREKKTEPRHGRAWCPGCDAALVGDGEKCPVCGTRLLSKRRKGNPRNR